VVRAQEIEADPLCIQFRGTKDGITDIKAKCSYPLRGLTEYKDGNPGPYQMNYKIDSECWEIDKSAECRTESNCYWDEDKKTCFPGQEGFKSVVPYVKTTEYPNGYAIEVFTEGIIYCESPFNAPNANLWAKGTKGTLYFIALLYLFFGVAIVADIFMSAIEVITSTMKEVVETDADGKQVKIEARVWNMTVANLTLLALGSSAPEILLATLETVGTLGEEAGELGPSTIVGSAAFNLFMIISVCMVSVPPQQLSGKDADTGTRRISQLNVFLITAFSSVFAYFWLYLCLAVISPDRVEVWEACVTFLMFPVLVYIAYMADIGWFGKGARPPSAEDEKITISNIKNVVREDTTFQTAKDLVRIGADVDDATLNAVANRTYAKNANLRPEKQSYMVYRVNAIRGMTGKRQVVVSDDDPNNQKLDELREKKEQTDRELSPLKMPSDTVIEFNSQEYAVREDQGSIKVAVIRSGDLKGVHTVDYTSVEGTAKAGEDFQAVEGALVFQSGERFKTIEVMVEHDEEVELDEFFYLTLANPRGTSISLGTKKICTIKIIDVSSPGVVGFASKKNPPSKSVQENVEQLSVVVKRIEGSMGTFTVDWRTQDGTALEGEDYVGAKGQLCFEPGEMDKAITVEIINNEEDSNRARSFTVILENPQNDNGTARLIEGKTELRIDISDDEGYSRMMGKIVEIYRKRKEQFSLATGSWQEQFEDAVAPPDDFGVLPYVLHAAAFPWKVLFAFIPPTGYYNGWLTFWCSLTVTGAVTYVIGDVASTFGCMIGWSKTIVAITVVALGTSMPDTFASKTATIMAPDADAAIGNVTGSNSVNVFLGLGLPWLIASLYQAANGEDYVTPQGTLGFAVGIFTPGAILCLATLLFRRYFVGAELGGSTMGRLLSSGLFSGMWFLFIALSVIKDNSS